MRWYRKAADRGTATAEGNIGHLYQTGLGVAADLEEAKRWYRRAAEHGSESAKQWLAAH